MKKQTLADKLAKLSFNSAAIQKSWQVHLNAFGPLLEPAFVENYQARIHLTNWLNKISQGNAAESLPLMKKVGSYIETDADRCLYAFCSALLFKSLQIDDQYCEALEDCVSWSPKFYLPYANLAQQQIMCDLFDEAAENYQAALKYYPQASSGFQGQDILARMHCNLGACYLFMHRYDEARAEFVRANHPDANVGMARLLALDGDRAGAEGCFDALNGQDPERVSRLREDVEKLLSRTHPHFFAQPTDPEKIAAYWQWFAQNASALAKALNSGDSETGIQAVANVEEQLHILFPFTERQLICEIGEEKGVLMIKLKDYSSKSLAAGMAQLLAACPETLCAKWRFSMK